MSKAAEPQCFQALAPRNECHPLWSELFSDPPLSVGRSPHPTEMYSGRESVQDINSLLSKPSPQSFPPPGICIGLNQLLMEILGHLQIWENSSPQGSDALLLTTVIWQKAVKRFQYLSHLAGHRSGPQRGNSSSALRQACPHMLARQPGGTRGQWSAMLGQGPPPQSWTLEKQGI